MIRIFATTFAVLILSGLLSISAIGQVDEICGEAGITPGLDSPFAHVPYVFGRVVYKAPGTSAKPPKITVILTDSQQPVSRWAVSKSGNYCFKRSGGGGTLVVEVDGLEVARRALPGMGSNQQREDFEIYPNSKDQSATPGSVSAKYFYPPNEKTADLYKKAAEAARAEDRSGVVRILKEITAADPADFVAWGELGSAYFRQNDFQQADAAYRHSLELKVDYSPSWINIGQLRMAQKQYEAAIEILKHAVELEPDSAKAFRLIGESYLQVKKGTLGAEALNTAIKLEPIGMAECHLTLAHLYDLAGAKQMAAAEYKNFLSKVPDHPDKKKFESYIKENGKK